MRPDIPAATRQAVFTRAGGHCEECFVRARLELHHKRYHTDDAWRTDIRGRETPDDLVALCRACHLSRHIDPNGEWWNDPVAMAEHWEEYFAALEKD